VILLRWPIGVTIVVVVLIAIPMAIMVILGAIIGIPAVFLKCKACMVTFIPFTILLCVIGGVIVGATGLIGGVVGAICDIVKSGKSGVYICSQTKAAAPKCGAVLAYFGDANCNKIGMSSGDKTCCKAMYSAKKTGCMRKEDDDNCKKGKASHTAGFVGIIAAIFGCITTCLACCTCCGGKSFFGTDHLLAQPVQVAPAAQVVVASNTNVNVGA